MAAPDRDPDAPARPSGPTKAAVTAVALGGVLGAEGRYGLAEALPHRPGEWPWATLVTNLAGCLFIGLLMVVLLEVVPRPHPLARPFLGVGILGGFTTFSTFALDADTLLDDHRIGLAVGYLLASLIGGLLAVVAGQSAGRLIGRSR